MRHKLVIWHYLRGSNSVSLLSLLPSADLLKLQINVYKQIFAKKKKKTHINTETNSISNMGYYLKTLPL